MYSFLLIMPPEIFAEMRAYATTAEARSTDCFAGAKAIKATPMTTSTADPISSPRAIRFRKAWNDITAAWAKLDHAEKAIRLRFSDGLRAAIIKKIPSVT